MEPVHQLAVVFAGAVVAGALARRLGQSVIPAYVLVGIALGPPGLGLVQDRALLEPLTLLGLALLLFFMGLESSGSALSNAPRRAAKDGAINLVLNFTPGFLIGLAFGWSPLLAAFLGLATLPTSTAVAVKSIIELRRVANADTGVVMNLMVVEDLTTAVMLAALAAVAFHGAAGPETLLLAALKAAALVAVFLLVGRPLVRRLGQRTRAPRPHHGSHELALLGVVAVVLGAAALAEGAGLSAALGAFLLGMVLADSVWGPRLRELVVPLRDAGAAAFFFAFGMMVEPGALGAAWPMLLLLVPVTLATKFATGLWVARGRGQTAKARLNIATALLPRGEFSIIAANVAAAAGLGMALGTVAGVYVVITAVVGSVLMTLTGRLVRAAGPGRFHGNLDARMAVAARRRSLALRRLARRMVPERTFG